MPAKPRKIKRTYQFEPRLLERVVATAVKRRNPVEEMVAAALYGFLVANDVERSKIVDDYTTWADSGQEGIERRPEPVSESQNGAPDSTVQNPPKPRRASGGAR